MNTKACTKCGETKSYTEFGKRKRNKDGYKYYCKICKREYDKQYQKDNRDKINKRRREYYQNNKEICKKYSLNNKELLKEYKKQYYIDNRDRISKYAKEYRKNNKPNIKKLQKKYYKENKIELLKKSKKYAKNNRIKINKYIREKNKNDRIFSMRQWQRRQLKRMVKFGLNKTEPSKNYFPYTAKQLKEHIESLWLDGMSWDNHAIDGWHIDHIIPLSSFGTTKKETIKANALNNLQPMWAEDNLIKNDTNPITEGFNNILFLVTKL